MQAAQEIRVVLVTAPNLRVARKLVRLALESRVVACGNLLPKLESHYWWQNKLEKSGEVLILFKTTQAALAGLEKLILENHPYDTPEIVTLALAECTGRYLAWIQSTVTPPGPAR